MTVNGVVFVWSICVRQDINVCVVLICGLCGFVWVYVRMCSYMSCYVRVMCEVDDVLCACVMCV